MSASHPPFSCAAGEGRTFAVLYALAAGGLSACLLALVNTALGVGIGLSVGLVLVVRGVRLRLTVSEQEVVVRNLLRTHRLGWSEVSTVRDARAPGPQGMPSWALAFERANGGSIVSYAVQGTTDKEAVIAAITAIATQNGIPVVATGQIPERGSRRTR